MVSSIVSNFLLNLAFISGSSPLPGCRSTDTLWSLCTHLYSSIIELFNYSSYNSHEYPPSQLRIKLHNQIANKITCLVCYFIVVALLLVPLLAPTVSSCFLLLHCSLYSHCRFFLFFIKIPTIFFSNFLYFSHMWLVKDVSIRTAHKIDTKRAERAKKRYQ